MKITFVLPVIVQNGGCRVVAIYAEKLRAMGHDVTVLSRQPQTPSWPRYVADRLRGHHRPEDPNRTIYFDHLGADHVQIPWKFPLAASDVPDGDIVIATWWRTAFEVAALPPEKGVQAYFVQHHEVHEELPHDLARGTYFLPPKKITIAGWLVEAMADLYGDHDVALVPNGVDLTQFSAPPRSKADVPTVGLLYAPSRFKGMDVALAALARVRQNFPDLRVIAFGATDPTPAFPFPPQTTFHRLPSQTDLAALYASCDAWLVPSRSEGFGLPILEAMACRTPVIATRTGAAPDLIEDGVEGFVVDIDDAPEMAARLTQILGTSDEAWQRMSAAAFARAQMCGWDDAARAFETALHAIIAQKSTP